MNWREWIAEMEERVELLRREAESGDGRHVEARLIKDLRLCAEEVEAVVEHLELQKICPFCLGSKDEGGHMPCCEFNAALEWLRGVGK